MTLISYSVDVINDVASEIDGILDATAELDGELLELVDDDDYPAFKWIDEIRNRIHNLCITLSINLPE